MAVYFTSDLHFNHSNIIRFCDRPFSSVQEMNEKLILNWNETVGLEDEIYCLGDFAFGSDEKVQAILRRLSGRKTLILGNHDYSLRKKDWAYWFFEDVRNFKEIKLQDSDANNKGVREITLCHFALRVWNHSHKGAWNLFGHSHGSLPEDPNSFQLDVGVDMRAKLYGMTPESYRPFSYAEVKQYMSQKTFKAVDHHGAD